MDNNIISLLTNPPRVGSSLFILEVVGIGFCLLLIGLIIFFLSKTSWMKVRAIQDLVEITTYKPLGAKKIMKQWMKIKESLNSGLESEFKLAIIEADSILDDVLKKLGYNGETLGERLKQVSQDILPSLENAQEAHKIRNNIVHDPDYRLNLTEAEKTISFYEKVLTELDFL
jgi:hypothetical protein